MNGKCTLCNRDTELVLSHIIPKFVLNWLKESAPGAIRGIDKPNKRIQDGEKQYLLCSDCEEVFSKWEKTFCEKLFLPLHNDPSTTTPIKYGTWALKFSVSVSWRVLIYYHRLGDLSHFSEEQRQIAQTASNVWRKFLLGELPHPGKFEQHLVLVDAIQSYSGSAISPFLNRYLLGALDMSPINTNATAFVYTKMGHLLLFGFIQEDNYKRWKGSKLHVNKGLIIPSASVYHLPNYIAEYLNEQANKAAKILTSVSPRQSQKIRKAIIENEDEMANSEVFRAMQYDVYHSGKSAFKITEPDKKIES